MSRMVLRAVALLSACVAAPAGTLPDDPCAHDLVFAGAALASLCLDVPYGPHPCQRLDAYLVDSATPTPVLIELHGGAFKAGARSQFADYLDRGEGDGGVIELALRHGISVISVGYRLSSVTDGECRPILVEGAPIQDPAHAFPVPHDDAAAALDYVRARALTGDWNIDPRRIAVIGNSAGGTLALGLALREPPPTRARWILDNAQPLPRGLSGVLTILAPTDFRPWAFDLCAGGEAGTWHFGASDLHGFRTDPEVLARREAASPLAWVAERGAPRSTHFLGLYAGSSSWTIADVYQGGLPCSGYEDPLGLPTSDAHAAAFGLLLADALGAAGNHAVGTVLVDANACDPVVNGAALLAVDFLAGALDRRPGYDLVLGAGSSSPGGGPRLSAFGRFEPGTQVTLWVRGAPPGALARLFLAPQATPEEHPGGLLVPGGPGLVILDLPASDGCGFLSVPLDPSLLAAGPLFAQVELTEPAPGSQQSLTDAWWLE